MLALALVLGACGGGESAPGDDDPGTTPPDEGPVTPPEGDADYVFPPEVHTGFDGSATFQVPLSTNLADPTWEVEDPSVLDIKSVPAPAEYADFGEFWAVVTTKKAGTTKVTAISGGKQVSATVTVAAYQPAQVSAGSTRYNNPDDASGAQRNACVSCHGLPNGVDHSPVTMAFFGDDEILSAITTGKYPDGYELQGVNHAWNLTDAEKAGIVPYLRSLAPRGF